MRIITGATERSNINAMYEDLGWVSLSRRRLIHRLTLFYKITNNRTPQYLADIVPPTVIIYGQGTTSPRYTHKNNVIQNHSFLQPYVNGTRFQWRSGILQHYVHSKNFPRPVKHTWFNTGNRFLNIHHTRIRLDCSKLKSDLHFNLFVEDDPFCTCDRVIEDAYHYFFICPNYNDQRLVLLISVSQITEQGSHIYCVVTMN